MSKMDNFLEQLMDYLYRAILTFIIVMGFSGIGIALCLWLMLICAAVKFFAVHLGLT